jgi:hypothetical protein
LSARYLVELKTFLFVVQKSQDTDLLRIQSSSLEPEEYFHGQKLQHFRQTDRRFVANRLASLYPESKHFQIYCAVDAHYHNTIAGAHPSKEEFLQVLEKACKPYASEVLPRFAKVMDWITPDDIILAKYRVDELGTDVFFKIKIPDVYVPTKHYFEEDLKLPRKVILDNLPHDISREAVMRLLQNCGGIEDVDIVRNDADIAKDSMRGIVNHRYTKLLARSYKSREVANSGTYAFVTFSNAAGKAAALSDPLRVLGTMTKGSDGQLFNCKTDDVLDKTVLLIRTGGLLNAEDCLELLLPAMQQFGVALRETSPIGVISKDGRCLIEFGDHAMAVAAYKLLRQLPTIGKGNIQVGFTKGKMDIPPKDYDPEHSSYFLSKPKKPQSNTSLVVAEGTHFDTGEKYVDDHFSMFNYTDFTEEDDIYSSEGDPSIFENGQEDDVFKYMENFTRNTDWCVELYSHTYLCLLVILLLTSKCYAPRIRVCQGPGIQRQHAVMQVDMAFFGMYILKCIPASQNILYTSRATECASKLWFVTTTVCVVTSVSSFRHLNVKYLFTSNPPASCIGGMMLFDFVHILWELKAQT